ncbi:MAG: sodium/proline symporter [Cyanobacteria bacterium P01_H01_bin.74]
MAIIISFLLFLLFFVVIGVLSSLKNKHTTDDYLLAGQNVKPWLVALSAVATNNSGYMFIGMIGYTYTMGISSVWMMIGWVLGDLLASGFIHKRLRIASARENVLSFSSVLSNWHGTDFKWLRLLGGLITIGFLGAYAAAQLNAGSKALHVLFGWDYSLGAIIGAAMVLLYCFSGGIRASIWTDAAQSFVMIFAMGLLLYKSVDITGGFSAFVQALNSVSPSFLSIVPSGLQIAGSIGLGLFIAGWVFAGFGVVGQPHIMVRFMTMDNPNNMGRVRFWYYLWYISFYILTIGTGLAARVLLPEASSFDAELAMPTLAQQILPEALVGLILAGLFAATMSTADSQILSCTASITNDFPIIENNASYLLTKFSTVFVTVTALAIALSGNDSVFSLVMIAWSALASGFAPLLTVYALGGKVSEKTGILMMLSGIIAMLAWRQLGLSETMYEAAPGIVAGFLPFFLSMIFKKRLA